MNAGEALAVAALAALTATLAYLFLFPTRHLPTRHLPRRPTRTVTFGCTAPAIVIPLVLVLAIVAVTVAVG